VAKLQVVDPQFKTPDLGLGVFVPASVGVVGAVPASGIEHIPASIGLEGTVPASGLGLGGLLGGVPGSGGTLPAPSEINLSIKGSKQGIICCSI